VAEITHRDGDARHHSPLLLANLADVDGSRVPHPGDMTVPTGITRRLVYFAGAALLLSLSTPTMSFAAEAFKDVVVRNTDANPVPVKVATDSQRLRHGQGVVGPAGGEAGRDVDIPADVVLTDLVVARARGTADSCNVVLYEDRGGDRVALAQLFPTISEQSRSLHFQTGIAVTADRLAVAVNNDCYINVLWSGYAVTR
jgi:hypothetical protein